MTGLGSCSSFSVATTVFVSLAICAVISYGVFYYFKQRLAIIEKSQMEQARIMQAIISHGLAVQHSTQSTQPTQPTQHGQKPSQKEITITQSSLIEVSSDDDDDDDESPKQDSDAESVSQSDSDSDESSSSSNNSSSSSNSGSDSAKWSIGDEIHQADGYHEELTESFKKNIMIDAICIDSGYVVDSVTIENAKANVDNANNANNANEEQQQKKIISLNRGALTAHNDNDNDNDDDDDDDAVEDDDDNDSSSSEDQDQGQEQGQEQDQVQEPKEFELKIGYKASAASNKTMQLNYGNMSVSALRQLAKERGLGGEDGDLQKLKKKDLVQLLQ